MPSATVITAWWRIVKRSRSRQLWQRLRIPSTAISSRNQPGKRTPSRIRASGIALRKLVKSRSLSACGLEHKEELFRRPHPCCQLRQETLGQNLNQPWEKPAWINSRSKAVARSSKKKTRCLSGNQFTRDGGSSRVCWVF